MGEAGGVSGTQKIELPLKQRGCSRAETCLGSSQGGTLGSLERVAFLEVGGAEPAWKCLNSRLLTLGSLSCMSNSP